MTGLMLMLRCTTVFFLFVQISFGCQILLFWPLFFFKEILYYLLPKFEPISYFCLFATMCLYCLGSFLYLLFSMSKCLVAIVSLYSFVFIPIFDCVFACHLYPFHLSYYFLFLFFFTFQCIVLVMFVGTCMHARTHASGQTHTHPSFLWTRPLAID